MLITCAPLSAAKRIASPVSARDGRRVLQPAALWMHEHEGRTLASAEELSPVLGPALDAVQWRGGGAADFLRAVRDDSGLLTGWGHDEYGFMHLGFQEYLAAREVRRRHFEDGADVLPALAARHGESWWREVALLLVGLEEPTVFTPYVREIAELPAFAEHPHLLDELLEDAAEVSKAPFVELLEASPGADEGLWARQLVALNVLERLDPEAVDALRGRLAEHPSSELRARVSGRVGAAERAALVTPRGGVELVEVPGGSFQMGDEVPRAQHRVDIRPFLLGRYPVTNEEYARFLEARPDVEEPAYWGDRDFNQARQPGVGVSWHDAERFCAWSGGRLPSEAEWEYAARAGTTTRFYHGDDEASLGDHAWYEANAGGSTNPVGQKVPNAFGLHDMLGNVWEWCGDAWHDDYEGAPTDGSAREEEGPGAARVLRGGSFVYQAWLVRCAGRGRLQPDGRYQDLGFRVASSPSSSDLRSL